MNPDSPVLYSKAIREHQKDLDDQCSVYYCLVPYTFVLEQFFCPRGRRAILRKTARLVRKVSAVLVHAGPVKMMITGQGRLFRSKQKEADDRSDSRLYHTAAMAVGRLPQASR